MPSTEKDKKLQTLLQEEFYKHKYMLIACISLKIKTIQTLVLDDYHLQTFHAFQSQNLSYGPMGYMIIIYSRIDYLYFMIIRYMTSHLRLKWRRKIKHVYTDEKRAVHIAYFWCYGLIKLIIHYLLIKKQF